VRPIHEIPHGLCRELEWFFTDIDDTMTSDGLLPERSYGALWDLSRAGIRVVPVTGRPAGWCDHIARMWPVTAVVGENGAFSYSYDRAARKMLRRYALPSAQLAAGRDRLERIAGRVLAEVPGAAVAADQPFRISDWAIDFREDVPPLSEDGIDAICRILAEEGVRYKVSSIHVNYWLGDFDKLSCVRRLLEESTGLPFAAMSGRIAFIGDSPNDEPLFAGIPQSIAVGNLRRFAARLTHLPRYITDADSAEGFCEAARAILDARGVLDARSVLDAKASDG
jgi:HAD superfamily hydrolase (TIGR01484 family)